MNVVEKSIIASVVTFNPLSCFSCGVKTNPGSLEDSNITYSGPPARLQGGPYPVSQKPDSLYVIEYNNFSGTELLTIQSLQGLLAQTKPRIYCVHGDGNPLKNLLI